MNDQSSRFLSRLSSTKRLPAFSGDPLDWLRFKQAFDLSTESGEYTEKENVMRLFDSLKDDAREATKALFASGGSTNDIIRTLEMRFGNRRVILEKIVNNVKQLPKIESGKIDLVKFASKLKDSVTAIKALGSIGQLHSPELTKDILIKISTSMLHDYARYAAAEGDDKAELEKISNFMFKEFKFKAIKEVKQIEQIKSKFFRYKQIMQILLFNYLIINLKIINVPIVV